MDLKNQDFNYYSLNGIIEALETDGHNTKKKVLIALKTATRTDLTKLRNSIQERINKLDVNPKKDKQ